MPVEVPDHQLKEYYDVALDAAKKAGKMILEAFKKEKQVDTKSCAADLVTATDQAVEKMAFTFIRGKYPQHKFIGEESTAESGTKLELTDDPTWIIDPIDGTTNFVHSIPEVCFSLGITVNKEPVIGIVYLPVRDLMYTAQKGRGAFLNGEKLSASGQTDLKKAVVICEGGSSRGEEVVKKLVENMHRLISASHGIRCYGSAAYNLCRVAQGCGDAYVEYGIHIWDFIAGMLIAREAGAVICDPTGGEIDVMNRRILAAATPSLVPQLSSLLVHLDMGRD
ncbi:inositol monophosphatase 1-like [Babylonia areolata]|uniref:inositol monophosphatase 1-like n=1 Tax=Babylonia areolata TaxID=304850 RepID=UPI003FD6BD5E